MQLKEATALILTNKIDREKNTTWADLGCGTGLFTYALAGLLGPGSIIHAIDKKMALKDSIEKNGVAVKTTEANFEADELGFYQADGILMANSLHYIKDKKKLLTKLKKHIKEDACFLIVEYDTDVPVSTWVPYPVSFSSLVALFDQAGYKYVYKNAVVPSMYGSGSIYAAIIKKNSLGKKNLLL